MPDIKRNFTKGKMNKDLDERLVPSGEYRDAMNIQVSTSEGSDVGTIQNVLGNIAGCEYIDPDNHPNPIPDGSTTVGSVADEKNDTLYWLVAGGGSIDSLLPLSENETGSLKDLIMRTNPAKATGCEPVFVDKYGWCVGINDDSTNVTGISLSSEEWYSNIIPGMNFTGYVGTALTEGPVLVNNIGNLTQLSKVDYFQGSTSAPGAIQQSAPIDLYLRTFEDPSNPGQFSKLNDHGVVNGAASTPGLDANSQVQTNIFQLVGPAGVLPTGWEVGATVDTPGAPNLGYLFTGAEIISIVQDSVCAFSSDIPGGGSCYVANIITIDISTCSYTDISYPSLMPNFQPNFNSEIGIYNVLNDSIANYNPIVSTPNNIINILPSSDQWLDEVYNIFYDEDGNYTNASLQISGPAAINFPADVCIDPNSVTSPTDDEYEIMGCPWNQAGYDYIPVNALNMNPSGLQMDFITAPQFGLPVIQLQNSVDLLGLETICFVSDRVLEFEHNNLITGVNVVDDMLFWTDNFTEPKKINIQRSILGTDMLGDTHTVVINEATGIGLVESNPVRKEHITVIRKSPKNSLSLELSSGVDPDSTIAGITYTAIDPDIIGGENKSSIITINGVNGPYDFSGLQVGDSLRFEIETDIDGNGDFELAWNEGDFLLLKEFDQDPVNMPAVPLANHTIRGVIKNWQYQSFESDSSIQDPSAPYGNNWPASAVGTAHVEIEVVSLNGTPPQVDVSTGEEQLHYVVQLEIATKPIFKDKFPRFSYRYKYADGEYSIFAPWSEVAFLPSNFNYEAKKGYNTGMTNHVNSITLQGFVPILLNQPIGLDITEIDILYKEEDSPNIYVLETISPLDIMPTGIANPWLTNKFEIHAETIKYTLPSNQLLRSWDNVPKKALAQDISGSRIIYGNYEQNFNLTVSGQKFKPEFKNYISSWKATASGTVEKSIKSLREYKLGVVFTDEYGRETPVLTSESSSFKIEKPKSINYNRLVARLQGNAPSNMTYFKFFVNETSTEYYNLPMDRWYEAEDGNIWLAFPSNDRNKIDLETSLYLKKGDNAIENTYTYKVLAIENEAPEFIKTRRIRIGSVTHNPANLDSGNSADPIYLWGSSTDETVGIPRVLANDMTLNFGGASGGGNPVGFGNSSLSHLDDITEDLYIQFISSSDYSSQYKISSITSDREIPTSGSIGIQPTEYYVTIDTSFKDDIDFIFDNPATPSSINDQVKIQFTKAVVENKPKFEGRFFVKIENDGKIKSQLDTSSTGVNYLRKTGKMVYSLESDDLLQVRSANAHFSDQYITVSDEVNQVNNPTGVTENLVITDYSGLIDSNFVGLNDNNPNGENFNFLYARQAYFGCAMLDEEGPHSHLSLGDKPLVFTLNSTSSTQDDYDNNYPSVPNNLLPGVWFIDKSTHKYKVPDASTNLLPWMAPPDTDNDMNDFSPAINSWNLGSPTPWSVTTHNGFGILDFPSHDYSKVKLAFGGIDNSGIYKAWDHDGGNQRSYHQIDHTGFENFFSIGEADTGNYDDGDTKSFVERINAGQSFRWKDDPTETIYTIDNQIANNNRLRFSRLDEGFNTSFSAVNNFNKLIKDPSSYHKTWTFDVVPDMSNWNPAANTTFMPNGLQLQDIKVLDSNVYPMDNSDPTTNTIVVDTLWSSCQINTNKPKYPLHKGMMLTRYNNLGVTASGNVIVKDIGPYNSNLAGGTGGYEITLAGYYEPLHYGQDDFDGTAFTATQNLEFRQVTMNSVSNFTEENTDFWKTKWHANGQAPGSGGSGGIAAVGYEIEMLEPVEEFEDGGYLPSDPYVWETEPKDDTGLDIYYEISENYPINLSASTIISAIPIYSKIENTSGLGGNWGDVTVNDNIFPDGNTIRISELVWIGPGNSPPDADGNVTLPIASGDTLKITKPNGVSFEVKIAEVFPDSGFPQTTDKFRLHSSIYNSDFYLNWHNCYSFGNGVESNRIKDSFNLTYIANGVKASSTLETEYKQERRKHGLIYSGIYNSTSGVNDLNQFIAAEKITKDINPIYGSIQKLKAGWGQGGDLIALCEDRILRILANKDALFNADGNTNITSTNRVLGTATPYTGEYGISKNPESFASEAYRAYFTDKVRGTVMRLSTDGLTPISNHGMKDWFRDHLKLSNKLTGSYDDKKDEYNITINDISKTVTFKEDVRGWVSFKSFVTNNGVSCANEYYTFKNGNLWRHHDETVGRNTFYGIHTNLDYSTVDVIFNEAPGSVKSFHTINYEGSNSKVTQNTDDNDYYNSHAYQTRPGWYVDNIFTNKESGDVFEFIEKEGKWFNYIRGKDVSHTADGALIFNPDGSSSFDQSSFAIQGLGVPTGHTMVGTVSGCTDPTALNYDPTANDDDGSCTYPNAVQGCMEPSANNFDCENGNNIWQGGTSCNDNVTSDDGSCVWLGCTDNTATNTTTFPPEATNYNNGGNIQDDGSCILPIAGCLDSGYYNTGMPNNATINDPSMCIDFNYGCLGTPGGLLAVNATNFNNGNHYTGDPSVDVNTDDGSCTWEYCNTPGDANESSMGLQTDIANETSGYSFTTGSVNATATCAVILGCTDGGDTENGDGFVANNYDANANTDDGSCLYTTICYQCVNGYVNSSSSTNNAIPNLCGNGTVNGDDAGAYIINDIWVGTNPNDPCVPGCVDPTGGDNPDVNGFCVDGTQCASYHCCGSGNGYYASNYDSAATWDPQGDYQSGTSSCAYPGCTDEGPPVPNNYDPNATVDDNSCDYTGVYGCTCDGGAGAGNAPANDCGYPGFPAANYDPNAQSGENGGDDSCTWDTTCYQCGANDGLVNVQTISDNSQPGWCDGDPNWYSASYVQGNFIINDIWAGLYQDAPCVPGCVDGLTGANPFTGVAGATNYNPNATWDPVGNYQMGSSSCTYVGCMDPNSTTFWYAATTSDPSQCLYDGVVWGPTPYNNSVNSCQQVFGTNVEPDWSDLCSCCNDLANTNGLIYDNSDMLDGNASGDYTATCAQWQC